MIRREDMLELTRRMTVQRHCLTRIAGAYLDADGIIDGTFNTFFRRLDTIEQQEKLAICREIPFSETNVNLKEYLLPQAGEQGADVISMLELLNQCGLENDGLLEVLYEVMGERYHTDQDFCILVFHGIYDIPRKGSDKVRQWESESVYRFLMVAFCPLYEDYEPGLPEFGFLYPAYCGGGADVSRMNVYHYDEKAIQRKLIELMGLKEG